MDDFYILFMVNILLEHILVPFLAAKLHFGLKKKSITRFTTSFQPSFLSLLPNL